MIIHTQSLMTGDMASGSEQGGDNVPVDSEWQYCGFFKTCWASTRDSFSGCLDCSDTVSSSQESIPQEGPCASFCSDLIASLGLLSFSGFVSPYFIRETSNQAESSVQGEEPIEVGGPLIKIDLEDLTWMINNADYQEKDETMHCMICLMEGTVYYGHPCNGEGQYVSLASIACEPCAKKIVKNKCPACSKNYANKEEGIPH